MNQQLQTLFDFINNNTTISVEEKDALVKAIKKADTDLTIAEFKLERTEKVKRTTAILLEETIEELEQKRKVIEESNTTLQKTLDDLKATQTQLIQSEKMASLGELTAGIAHEIQNPLNFVNNFSEVSAELLAEMQDEINNGNLEDAKEILIDVLQNLEKINHHGKRADAIVKGMLQHSRSSSGKKEMTDLNALCDEYLRLSYHGLRAKDKSFNATMNTDFDETIGKIEIIPQDFGRVVLNLINNAFYAVSIVSNNKANSKEPDYEPTVSIATKKENDKIIIQVTDNGSGMSKEIMDKVFQPFFTTKPTGKGTGLGLSMSYDIITKGHNGELNVSSIPNEGTIFKIQIPI
jgi:signal transduction histidine kinase